MTRLLLVSLAYTTMAMTAHIDSAMAQPPPVPYECCFTATCVTCEQVAACEALTPFIFTVEDVQMPTITGYGFGTGYQNCGFDHPAGVLCSSWTENSFALSGADCLEPACVNLDACNTADYDLTPWEAGAVSDLSLCEFPEPCQDCDGNCLEDINANGVCDCDEVFGCMDSLACNYVPASVWDSDTCVFPEDGYDCSGNCLDEDQDGICLLDEIYGCTDTLALNYHPFITEEDSSCVYAADFTTDCASCEDPCVGDLNGDFTVSISDILILLTYFTYTCPQ